MTQLTPEQDIQQLQESGHKLKKIFQPVEHKKSKPPKFKNALDRISRRERRGFNRNEYNNNRTPKNSGFLMMGIAWDPAAVHTPRHKKPKGWQKELKRQTFNKKRA
jgi:hypothetical protein